MTQLYIQIPKPCPRLEFTVRVLFERFWNIQIEMEVNSELASDTYFLLNLDKEIIAKHQSSIFFSTNLIQSIGWDWAAIAKKELCNDWLGFCFYTLSRMEEYGRANDPHGRFSHTDSILFSKGLLENPIVEELTFAFVQKHFPENISITPLLIVPTLDIDMTHAVKGRPFFRQLGACAKSVLKGSLKHRLAILRGKKSDPYDNFDYQIEQFKKINLKACYFFQVGDYSKYDKNISHLHPLFNEVISKLKKHHIGLHPSYYSKDKPTKFISEKKRLESVCKNPVSQSRQHFLRFSLPQTYQDLIKIGIQTEFSMGYSEVIGFRAGVSRAFPWYDLESEHQTELIIQPFSVMDVALQFYAELNPEEAIIQIRKIKEKLYAIHGEFSFCFHNESLSESMQWKGWRKVFEEALNPIS